MLKLKKIIYGIKQAEGMDSVSLQHCLLCFGEASANLRLVVTSFFEWLANHMLPWLDYYALMSGSLIRLDN